MVREGVTYFQQRKRPKRMQDPPEAWSLMMDRDTRISRFWGFVESAGFDRNDLVEFSDDDDEPDPSGRKTKRRNLLKAF